MNIKEITGENQLMKKNRIGIPSVYISIRKYDVSVL
jgi:hypothetical protein